MKRQDRKPWHEYNYSDLMNLFLLGEFDKDIDASVQASVEMHNKLNRVEDLVPLLLSNNRMCVSTAVYIAHEEGSRARPIFPYILSLLGSKWSEVRCEAASCFPECATCPEHLLILFTHVHDRSQFVRWQVLTVLSCLYDNQLELLHKHILKQPGAVPDNMKRGILLLCADMQGKSSYGDIVDMAQNGSEVEKYFAFATALRGADQNQIRDIAEQTGVVDLIKYSRL